MVYEKIKALICSQFDTDEESITKGTTLEELGADSLDVTELIMALEDEFGIEIDDESAEEVYTVGDIAELIEKRI